MSRFWSGSERRAPAIWPSAIAAGLG
jgi:hypothetical protein